MRVDVHIDTHIAILHLAQVPLVMKTSQKHLREVCCTLASEELTTLTFDQHLSAGAGEGGSVAKIRTLH